MLLNNDHREKPFENAIVNGFVEQGWFHSGNDEGYDPQTGLFVPDLIHWMETAYENEWRDFSITNPRYQEVFIAQIAQGLQQKGTLRMLNDEVGMAGMPFFKLSEKEPENQQNLAVVKRYSKNILRVMQQVHFRIETRESIDLVFFINGIPVATAEVKSNFTQQVNDAVEEYRNNRHPRYKTKGTFSPLLTHGRGAIVHFAISETDIQMTTRLEGKTTRFLPFNMGYKGHAGNAPATEDNPYPVSYFWKEVGRPATWLRLFHSFVFTEAKRVKTAFGNEKVEYSLIFPRYHQLRAVTKIVDDVKRNGVGCNYLIEHSPGSGKTKTITWTAFRLTEMREPNGDAVFDTVLIITDRTNLDKQLLEAVRSFNRTSGLVKGIDRKDGSKTSSLQTALEDGLRIVVVTIQTFPFAMEQIILNDKLKNRKFAVIIDEAHNSQSSKSSAKLNAALGFAGEQMNHDNLEDFIASIQKSRKRPANVSFLGFTATPRHQTMMLFGRMPDGSPIVFDDLSSDEIPVSFDVYPMRQAIEEGFIIDVLQGFTSYETAWQLEHKADKDPLVNEKDARRRLTKWKNLHPTNVTQKTQFIIQHFSRNIAGLLNGQAKAMIVTSSRAAVVRYKRAFDEYIKAHPELNQVPILRLGVPVAAFSGDVKGEEAIHEADRSVGFAMIDPEAVFNEANLNPDIRGALENAFDKNEYRLMIVANKFQTGFDQPKLCAMYIDKPLGSEIEIVQTYSRLNRIFPGKDSVFIVDFVNDPDSVKKAFAKYDDGATINEKQDTSVIFGLRDAVLEAQVFNMEDVEEFSNRYYYEKLRAFSEGKSGQDHHGTLNAIFEPLASNFNDQLRECYETCEIFKKQLERDELEGIAARIESTRVALAEMEKTKRVLEDFRKTLNKTVSTYNYLAQLVDFKNPDLEVFVAFCALLSKYLKRVPKEEIDISGVLLTGYTLRKTSSSDTEPKKTQLKPIGVTIFDPKPEMPEHLKAILEKISNFAGDIVGGEDATHYVYSISNKIKANDRVMVQISNNDRDDARKGLLEPAVSGAVIDLLSEYENLTRAVLENKVKKEQLIDIVLTLIQTQTKESELRRKE